MVFSMIPLLVVAFWAGPGELSMNDLVQGNNQFAIDLYSQARTQPGNLFYSPYSISMALAMTFTGAHGQTAREMAATLHFPSDAESFHAKFAGLDAQILGGPEPRPYQLTTANALWGQQGLSYDPRFLQMTERYYRAGLHPIDFKANPEAARKTINAWIESQTHDKIKDLLASGTVDELTDLILTNAIYFKGAWAVPFPKPETKEESFATGTERIPVSMMHQTGQFGYIDDKIGGLQALSLPYAGNSLAMVVLLPKKPDGLDTLEATLSASKLDGWINKLSSELVEVSLPRFKLDAGLDLKKSLQSLGMVQAFTAEADFTGMTTDRRLNISAVIHKAFVAVNEEGTEAAAATAVLMVRSLAMVRPKPPVVFRADHPFLFLIRDVRSGSILFMGRVTNPKG